MFSTTHAPGRCDLQNFPNQAAVPQPELFVYQPPRWQLQLAHDNREQLARVLGVSIEADWPVFAESLSGALATPGHDWGPCFGIELVSRRLVAMGGYYAPPDAEGGVVFGYAIAAAARGRGLGLAFARTLLRRVWPDPSVRQVDAYTLADGVISEEGFDNRASVAVLRRLGFDCIGSSNESLHWRMRLPR